VDVTRAEDEEEAEEEEEGVGQVLPLPGRHLKGRKGGREGGRERGWGGQIKGERLDYTLHKSKGTFSRSSSKNINNTSLMSAASRLTLGSEAEKQSKKHGELPLRALCGWRMMQRVLLLPALPIVTHTNAPPSLFTHLTTLHSPIYTTTTSQPCFPG